MFVLNNCFIFQPMSNKINIKMTDVGKMSTEPQSLVFLKTIITSCRVTEMKEVLPLKSFLVGVKNFSDVSQLSC